MNILQMQQFKMIAENESITKSAEKLYISAPALSKVLYSLEEELGCNLFDRIGRKIKLNHNGQQLLEYVNVILKDYEQIYQHFNTIEKPLKPVRLCEISGDLLDFILKPFFQKNPHIPVEKEIQSYKKALDLLLDNQADIVFTDNFSLDDAAHLLKDNHISKLYLLKNDLFLTTPCNKYENIYQVNLRDLINEKLIRVSENDPKSINFSNYLEDVCLKEKVKLNFIQHYDYDYFAKIASNSSFSYISDSLHAAFYREACLSKRFIKISSKSANQQIYLCYRNNDQNVFLLANYIIEVFYSMFKSFKMLSHPHSIDDRN
ncbi:transcriptional regulator [Desulfosporosinus orientis DSM 765]|uniref:Transcriptional regulator n=1 Tax=Desulfosporosinus orientis (strain ATCC 19365 / DSM 765 / NCIMB 8382 / VKM B-1628 / Singapore I) TaxID=768706 RepID=G7W6F1_DESOD|nr:LysR family transcriptional regulator [Desulfosporosinus orientis]AET68158.1 transcriptional regulator [Desulfosporosinus orientis DSM 765]